MNAFEWIISHLRKLDPNFIEKGQKEGEKQELLEEAPLDGLNEQNVMNILQTLDFLKLKEVYEQVWYEYLEPQFSTLINRCSLNLSGLNSRFLQDVNNRVKLQDIMQLEDRKDPNDKFLSNLFRQRLDTLLQTVELFSCECCGKIMTV